jgi:hypothetical protein
MSEVSAACYAFGRIMMWALLFQTEYSWDNKFWYYCRSASRLRLYCGLLLITSHNKVDRAIVVFEI